MAAVKGKRSKRPRPTSPLAATSPSSLSNTSQEEEDTAYCLMLLAQGRLQRQLDSAPYECKTLGGHRASHKKLMPCSSWSNALTAVDFSVSPGKVVKVHACGYCGTEFSSGQALGGHMRRHRSLMAASTPPGGIQVCLDLNLPAPEEQEAETLVFTAGSLVDCRY